MAIERDHQVGAILLKGIYWTFDVIELRVFDETAQLKLKPYLTEDLRRQKLTEDQKQLPLDEQIALKTRIDVPGLGPMTVYVDGESYQQYFSAQTLSAAESNPVEAAWRYVTEVDEPRGLRQFFTEGKRV